MWHRYRDFHVTIYVTLPLGTARRQHDFRRPFLGSVGRDERHNRSSTMANRLKENEKVAILINARDSYSVVLVRVLEAAKSAHRSPYRADLEMSKGRECCCCLTPREFYQIAWYCCRPPEKW